ncbi:MAG: ZIP family metal transporter [Bacteroidales bacterium]|nr:ZIP family metal transporter [Bacteroidales bacterium]
MTTEIYISYGIIMLGVIIWGALIPRKKMLSSRMVDGISTFGGAFLLASCFINLVPHMYLEGYATPVWGFKVGAAAMIGFLIQILLEQLTHGVEHGHHHDHVHHHESNHDEDMEYDVPAHTIDHKHCTVYGEHAHSTPILGLMLGLCIHSFIEGMPMVDGEGDIHQGLLWGIVLHNIPITLVLISLCMSNRYSNWKTLGMLAIFALMTPLGSLTGLYLFASNEVLSCLMMGLVVGILLHVSVSILFDHDHNKFSWFKLALIVLAFVAAYFTPGCPEIYG